MSTADKTTVEMTERTNDKIEKVGEEKNTEVCATSNEAKNNERPEQEVKEVAEQTSTNNGERSANVPGQKRKADADLDSPNEKKSKKQKLITKKKVHQCYARLALSEDLMRELDYPRPDPSGKEGHVKLYGNHFGFKAGYCKRCDKLFDTTFSRRTQCDFHMERSKRFNGRQHPHGCCGKGYGSRGCRTAPSHVHKGNLYLDLENYKATEKKESENDKYTIYAVDTESIHTKKGIEVCRVTVVDRKLKVVYNEFCLPTTEVVDYNTIWSGITEKDLNGVTKTFEELRDDMLKLFSADTILVGHGLSSDLIALKKATTVQKMQLLL
ncbi:exonuclease GOR-like isoform X2 [Mercenaria mercenaria]|uniref:exonuclease GOR-like isoform X2 n=1 Tax=Mercenaria mercenaria TaxID=6596 RepID=UPI00234F226A|nr:exonuclease GOR-like isoform X2 [Mercenaria mercenaria]